MGSIKLNPGLLSALAREPGLAAALEEAANNIADQARDLVPVRTGKLQDSIEVVLDFNGVEPVAHIVAGNAEAFYAAFVEFGTSQMAAESYLRRAAEAAGYQLREERSR